MLEDTRLICTQVDRFGRGSSREELVRKLRELIEKTTKDHPDDANTRTSLENDIAYYTEKEEHTPEEFTMDYIVINGVPTRVVYKLNDHGIVQCGKNYKIPLKVFSDDLWKNDEHYYANGKYNVSNNVDGEGCHRHISANIAGFPIEKPHKLKYDDTYTAVKLIRDKDTQELIKRYFVEKLGACPTAVNFQS